MFRRSLLSVLLAVAVTPGVWARLATAPLEAIIVAAPTSAPAPAMPPCHEVTDELTAAGPCALCATCHLPAAAAPAPAATGSAPRPAVAPAPREAERRSTRRQAERLDRPPYIRPM